MPRILFIIFSSILLVPVGSAETPSQQDPALSDLDALTGRWIALRGTLAEEKRDWRERKSVWEEEIELLEEESSALQKEIEAGREVLSSAEERREALLARSGKTESELEELDTVLSRVRLEVETLLPLVPDSLRDRIPALQGDGGRSRDAQRLTAALAAIESLHNQLHGTRELIEMNGQARQVDVLYLGLARGFAVSPKNDWAAIGVPGEDGWIWSEGQVDPHSVRTLIEVYHQRETATLVPVPLTVEDSP